MINENILTELKQLKQSIEEVSVYDLNVYSSMELYSRVAGKINELIKEVMTYQGLLSEELLKELDYINNHLDTFLYEIRTNSEMAINDMNNAKDEMIEQVTNQINENQLLINSLLNYSNRLSYLERMLDLLYSENASHRTNMILEGNHLSLTNSKEGLIQVNSTQGNTLVNLNTNELLISDDFKCDYKLSYSPKKSTLYTIILDLSYTTTEGASIWCGFLNNEMSDWRGRIFDLSVGTNVYTLTTTDNDDIGNRFRIGWYPDKITNVTVNSLIILEGDYTNKPIPNYFIGMQSSFEDKLVTQEMVDSAKELAENLGKYKVEYKVTGKNKFDGVLESGTISSETGDNIVINQEVRCKNYIKMPNSPFVITIYPDNKGYIGLRYYDKNYKYLGSSNGVKHGSIVGVSPHEVPSETYYIRFKLISTDLSIKFQIEEGTQATPYEPYKEQVKTYYLNSPLLEGDTIEDSGDNVVHVHRSELVAYTEGDESTYPTDLTNTLKTKASPTYEVISQNDDLKMKCFNDCSLDYETVIPVEQTDIIFTGEGTSTTSLLVDDVNLETDEITREV